MRFIEIRLQEGLLLLGMPGMFPGALHKSSDEKLLVSALRKLTTNPPAMAHLRRNWLELGQRVPVVNLDDHELLVQMRREISRGRLCAAMLGTRRRSAGLPDVEEQAASPVIHLHHDGKTILIAPKGKLPHEFSGYKSSARAAEIIRKVSHASPSALAIDKQASRLSGGSAHSSSGPQLREHIAWQLERGGHEAVVLDHPHLVQKAAQLPSAPRPVSQWSLIEKIREALRLSITHLPAELVNAAAIALIMEMGIALGALIAAQFVPGGGEVVDAVVAAVVYRIAGVAGLIAFWQIAHATYIAANANSEAELDEAGQEYAAGFVAIGLAKLAEIRAKLLEGKLGGGAKETSTGRSSGKSSGSSAKRSGGMEPESPKPTSAEASIAAKSLEFSGSKPVRIIKGTNGKVAVMGRSMGDGTGPGVRSYAKAYEKELGPIETFDGNKISDAAQREWKALTAGGRHLPPDELKETLLFKENQAWAQKLKDEGYTILDLGDPTKAARSEFYEIEKKVIFGD